MITAPSKLVNLAFLSSRDANTYIFVTKRSSWCVALVTRSHATVGQTCPPADSTVVPFAPGGRPRSLRALLLRRSPYARTERFENSRGRPATCLEESSRAATLLHAHPRPRSTLACTRPGSCMRSLRSVKDFQPVSLVATVPTSLRHAQLPLHAEERVDSAKRTGKITSGSAGTAARPLAMEYLSCKAARHRARTLNVTRPMLSDLLGCQPRGRLTSYPMQAR